MTVSQSDQPRQLPGAVRDFLDSCGIHLLVALCALLFFVGTAASPISMTAGDAQPSLLVSQALLEHQTVHLDRYQDQLSMPLQDDYRFEQRDGHYYYFFPLGTSFFAAPAVWLANHAGLDMTVPADNDFLQNLLSSLTVVVVFLVGYQIAALYLSPVRALFITVGVVAGSSLVSTLGTALWNTNLAVVFVMLSLWLVLRRERGWSDSLHPVWLGLFLAAAYFTRPTTATFIAVWLGYLLVRHRPAFLKVVTVAACCFLLILFFNRAVYGQWLPPYSSLSRLQSREAGYLRIFRGLLASPSRGFFVFHPHFLLILAGSLWLLLRGKRQLLQASLLLWVALSVVAISQFAHWWGGHAYGPRLLAEIVPAFLVLGSLVAREGLRQKPDIPLAAIVVVFTSLSLFAIFIHSFQGLYNQYTARWNHYLEPNVDDDPDAIFNWNYPQFLATNRQLCTHNRNYLEAVVAQGKRKISVYRPGEQIQHNAGRERAVFVGWSPPETDFRWSACRTVHILFRPTAIDPDLRYRLLLSAGSFEGQTVTLRLNDYPLGQLNFPAQVTPPVERGVALPGVRLHPNAVNDLVIEIPAARSYPGVFDRYIGLSLVSLAIELSP